ncbi:MAG: response regulator [Nitrospirae bacterium]|nr:MAG: response regulator [Nitrospirota bacterium]
MQDNPFSTALGQQMIDAISVGVLVLNPKAEIQAYNHAAMLLLDWQSAAVIGRTGHEILDCVMPDRTPESTVCPIDYVYRTGNQVWCPKLRVRTLLGQWKWVELSVKPFGDLQPCPNLLLTVRNVSHELEMLDTVQRLASIPEESPFPIIDVDAGCHILYANRTMINLMAPGGIGLSGFAHALPDRFPHVVREALNTQHVQKDLEVMVGDRVYSWVLVPHAQDGIVRGYGLDITERKIAADELAAFADMVEAKNRELDRALVEAEAAKRAKTAFLAAMSHEIRTPLNGVIGMTEILLDYPLTSEQRECAEAIKHSANGLRALINDILDFSKIEAGKLELETIPFDLEDLLDDVMELVAKSAQQKGLDFVWTLDPHAPSVLLGDPTRLKQILLNLASNGVKFTERGGVRIDVAVSRFPEDVPPGLHPAPEHPSSSLHAADQRIYLTFSVVDTGIGLSPDAQSRVFEKFTQADASTTRKYGGTGLGLAICKQLVELMGGTIGVESRLGQGSTFWFRLPFRTPSQSPLHSRQERDGDDISDRRIGLISLSSFTQAAVINIFARMGLAVEMSDEIEHVVHWLDRLQSMDRLPDLLIVHTDASESGQHRVQHMMKALHAHDTFRCMGVVWLVPRGIRRPSVPEVAPGSVRVIHWPARRKQFVSQVRSLIRRSDLDSRLSVVARPSPHKQQVVQREQNWVSRHGHPKPRILVAEDNPVNQRVVGWILEKLGCDATFVTNGREAVAATEQTAYDAIIMDWQMPEMDGLEATALIRARERERDRACNQKNMPNVKQEEPSGIVDTISVSRPSSWATQRVPIIGMTANALEGDREICLEAGMDEYVPKPLRSADLKAALQRWLVDPRISIPESDACRTQCADAPRPVPGDSMSVARLTETGTLVSRESCDYDVKRALHEMDGDAELLLSLVCAFLVTGPGLMDDLNAAYTKQDIPAFRTNLHRLKGSLGALRAHTHVAMITQLEQATRSASSIEAESYRPLCDALSRLLVTFKTLRDEWSRNAPPSE